MTEPQASPVHARVALPPHDAFLGAVESHLDALESQIRWLRKQADEARSSAAEASAGPVSQPELPARAPISKPVPETPEARDSAEPSAEPIAEGQGSASSVPEWREKSRRAREERARFLEELRASREAAAHARDAESAASEPEAAAPTRSIAEPAAHGVAACDGNAINDTAMPRVVPDEMALPVQASAAASVTELPASGAGWLDSWYATARPGAAGTVPSESVVESLIPAASEPVPAEPGQQVQEDESGLRFRSLPIDAASGESQSPAEPLRTPVQPGYETPPAAQSRVFRRVDG